MFERSIWNEFHTKVFWHCLFKSEKFPKYPVILSSETFLAEFFVPVRTRQEQTALTRYYRPQIRIHE